MDARQHWHQTALHEAASSGHVETLAELLKRGARTTIQDKARLLVFSVRCRLHPSAALARACGMDASKCSLRMHI